MSRSRRQSSRKDDSRRRYARPYSRRLHVESLEDRRLLAVITVTTNQDVVDPDDEFVSLREAIADANLAEGPDEIDFDFGHDGPETIVLTNGELLITGALTIDGTGPDLLTIKTTELQGLLRIDDLVRDDEEFDVTISGITLDGMREFADNVWLVGSATMGTLTVANSSLINGRAFAIDATGDVVVQHSVISGTVASTGALSTEGDATIVDSVLHDNYSFGYLFRGGGAVTASGNVIVERSIFTENQSQQNGGAIWAYGSASIVDSAISENSSLFRYGGAVFARGPVTMASSTITGNSAQDDGGAVFSRDSVAISQSTINGNRSLDGPGGAVYAQLDLSIDESELNDNSSGGSGGAIHSGGSVTVTSSTLDGNTADNGGGGAIFAAVDVSIADSTVSNNTAGRGLPNGPGGSRNGSAYGSGGSPRDSGGGIHAGRDLLIERSLVTGNRTFSSDGKGAGAYAPGSITVIDSAIENNHTYGFGGNGGGLSNGSVGSTRGVVTIVRSSISNNSTANDHAAGAGLVGHTIVLRESAVTGNTTSGDLSTGAGMWGINFDISNSTISGNRAEYIGSFGRTFGGGIRGGSLATFKISHSTITNNFAPEGGGIFVNQALAIDISHTIIAANMADSFPDVHRIGGFHHSLIGDIGVVSELEAPVGSPDENGNLIGGPINGAIDPRVAPLADNGGPTLTHSLLPSSPAIDAGDPDFDPNAFDPPLMFDQRGDPFDRVIGAAIDIGAFESLTVTVNDPGDFDDGEIGNGTTTLREAINYTNGLPGPQIIDFAFGHDGSETILLTEGDLLISDTLTIAGPAAELLTIDASGNDPTPEEHNRDGSRVFFIDDGTSDVLNVTISDVTLTGADSLDYGGAVFSFEDLRIERCAILDNAAVRGGGVYGQRRVEVVDSTVSGNLARRIYDGGFDPYGGYGGGILAGDLVLSGSAIRDNEGYLGGGVYSSGAVIETSFIDANQAQQGGGIFNSSGDLLVTNSSVISNSGWLGGGIQSSSTSDYATIIRSSTISGNEAQDGAGISSSHGELIIQFSTVANNRANTSGGGIWRTGGAMVLQNSIVASNIAPEGTDIRTSNGGVLAEYSLIGTRDRTSIIGPGNRVGSGNSPLDPRLAPLADNGGSTLTHALLPGSPAIDAGDPSIQFDENEFDQRGPGYFRVADGDVQESIVIDIGAYESQGIPGYPIGDYNRDGIASLADYVLWRNTEGDEVEPFSRADGSGDGTVGPVDYAIWREHYGNTEIPLLEVGSGESGADTGTAEAVTAGGELPYVPTGEAASAAGRVTNYFHAPTHEPTTTDAALLLLLADRRESISQGNAPFARTANTSLETPRDDFFATLGVDLSVAL